jgi:NADPH:quinone reductase-like Zn-dependent oxidoreductase
MKAVRIHHYGNNDRVVVDDVPRPEPGADDLLVSVRAASINPVDFKIRDGKVKVLLRYRMPLTLGNDLSGVVEAVGANVTRFKVGDAIYARLDKQRIGALADYALVSESAAARKPERLSHEEAASIPLVGLTAWQALVEIGQLAAGQKVLIHAGSGGVGTFAIQLAKQLGAFVATTASARNAELVKRLGADQVIDYKATRFESAIHDCDVVFDTQGGETLERSFSVVRRGGVVVTVGGRPDGKFARAWGLNPLLVALLSLLARRVTRLARAHEARFEYLFMRASGEQLEKIGALLESGAIKPVIDRTFALADTRDALAYVESGRAVGKVVVRVPG